MSTEEFSFLVTNGLKAGDVVCAKTSTGAKVKVTIPADAQEGDTVRFALPSQVQARRAHARTNTDGPQFAHLEGLFHLYFCQTSFPTLQITTHKKDRRDVVVHEFFGSDVQT